MLVRVGFASLARTNLGHFYKKPFHIPQNNEKDFSDVIVGKRNQGLFYVYEFSTGNACS
jgi:hypothetical protein